MSKELQIRIKTVADTAGVDKAQQAINEIKGDASRLNAEIDARLAQIRGNAGATGEGMGSDLGEGFNKGAKGKIDIGKMLELGSIGAAAFGAGMKIAEGVNAGIERMAERGNGLESFLNLDKATGAAVENLKKVQAELDAVYAKLAEVPVLGIEAALERVADRAKNATNELKRLRDLEETATGAENAEIDAARDAEEESIKNDPNLTPEQKQQDLAKLKQQRLYEGATRRDQERTKAETDAYTQVDIADSTVNDAANAEVEARRRADRAAQIEKEAAEFAKEQSREKESWALSDDEAAAKVKEFEDSKLAELRGVEGIGSSQEELKGVDAATKAREKAEAERVAARERAAALPDANLEASAADWQATNREIAKAEPPAADPAVGQAAQQAAGAAREGAGQVSSEMQTLAPELTQSFNQIRTSIGTLVDSIREQKAANQATADAVRQLQQEVGSTRQSSAAFNR